MKVPSFATGLFLTATLLIYTGKAYAFQTVPKPKTINKTNQNPPKYKYHEASSLSGIAVQHDRKSGTFILTFDQYLSELGVLHLKNNAGKIVYAKSLEPTKNLISHTMNVGRLNPGLYSIEVKTSDTTFWKKVRIKN